MTRSEPVLDLGAGAASQFAPVKPPASTWHNPVFTLRKRSFVTCFSAPIVDVYRYS